MPFSARQGFFSTTEGTVTPSLWTPNEVSTVFWLDAKSSSTITIDGTGVNTWEDVKGNYTFTRSLGNPTYNSTTDDEYVYCDGDDVFKSGTRFGLGANPDMMLVALLDIRTVNTTSDKIMQLSDTGAGTGIICLSTGTGSGNGGWSYRHNNGYKSFGATTTQVDTLTSWVRATGDSYADSLLWLDGTSQSVDSTSGTAATTYPTSTSDECMLGGGSSSLGYDGVCDVRFRELVFVNSTSTDTRQKIEGYMMWRWGLEANLPTGHPYKDAAPMV